MIYYLYNKLQIIFQLKIYHRQMEKNHNLLMCVKTEWKHIWIKQLYTSLDLTHCISSHIIFSH